MAIINPLKAIRPTRDKVSLVASRSYLTYSQDTLIEKLENNPYTFLHIINPDYSDKIKVNNQDLKYKLVKSKFNSFLKNGIFLQDSKDSIYIYEQTNESHCFTGFIAGSSIEEYLNGKIKIHEQTISSREEMFSKYLNETGFNAEPVLLTYNNKSEIDTILETNKKSRPEYEFATTNKTIHKLWVIDKEKEILQIQKEFSNVGSLYIADGHHRMASSSLLYKKQKTKNNSFCLSFFIAKNQLNIINFNRLVKDLNKLNSTSFIEELKKKFIVTKEDYLFEPKAKNEIGMYFENNWYSLKNNFPEESNIVDNLDPSILTNKILSPILNIHDLRNDKRVDFISGDNLRKAKELVDKKDFKVLFVLKKESVNKLMQVADLGLSMPPKSTYILPKLRSGLIIYKLK